MRRRTEFWLSACVCVVGMLVISATATASFHKVKIREVHFSGPTHTGDYVVLQATELGQNLFLSHYVSFRDATGMAQGDHAINVNGAAAGAANQGTFLLGNSGVTNADDKSGNDETVYGAGGAVCYEEFNALAGGIDCVTYGAFVGNTKPTSSPAGSPAPAMAPGQSIVRSISGGCATLLEESDDTNNSAADFAIGAPNPRNSSTVPTEKQCGTTTKKCKKKKKKHKKTTSPY